MLRMYNYMGGGWVLTGVVAFLWLHADVAGGPYANEHA